NHIQMLQKSIIPNRPQKGGVLSKLPEKSFTRNFYELRKCPPTRTGYSPVTPAPMHGKILPFMPPMGIMRARFVM
ncbi:hypothetical protein, partial [Komagataeibacter swingsii]|uniref:hypothetical protein n=1 Tax=Komagataeibacter swingsii TaxID=215220 RepID=UPI002231EC59